MTTSETKEWHRMSANIRRAILALDLCRRCGKVTEGVFCQECTEDIFEENEARRIERDFPPGRPRV